MSSLLDYLLAQPSAQDRFMQLQQLMPQGGGGGGGGGGSLLDSVDSTYTGGNGSFNETHEGPGTDGLTFGQPSQYTELAQKLFNFIDRRFPEVTMGGIQANRNIAGTSTPSEHAYGAALDIMVGSNSLGDQVYRLLTRPRVAERFDYSNVLWEVPNHFNHLHAGWLY